MYGFKTVGWGNQLLKSLFSTNDSLKVLPTELSSNTVRLTCMSTAKGDVRDVYMVGTMHRTPVVEVVTEFRVSSEEAKKYGAKVILCDRPGKAKERGIPDTHMKRNPNYPNAAPVWIDPKFQDVHDRYVEDCIKDFGEDRTMWPNDVDAEKLMEAIGSPKKGRVMGHDRYVEDCIKDFGEDRTMWPNDVDAEKWMKL